MAKTKNKIVTCHKCKIDFNTHSLIQITYFMHTKNCYHLHRSKHKEFSNSGFYNWNYWIHNIQIMSYIQSDVLSSEDSTIILTLLLLPNHSTCAIYTMVKLYSLTWSVVSYAQFPLFATEICKYASIYA